MVITLSADWLRARWSQLATEGSVPIPLSRWDDGDAFTLAELGPLPAPEQVSGQVFLQGRGTSGAPVLVELTPLDILSDSRRRDTFVAPDGGMYRANGRCIENATEREVSVLIVEVVSALAERRAALIESSLLADASVAVIGLGTGGVHVALELAKAGVGRFVLVDADRLDVGNIARHHAGISHAGRRKVYVARDLILEKNPGTKVETHPVAAGAQTERLLGELIGGVDVVVCATDFRASKLFVNRIAVAAGKTALYGGAFRRAYGGQILRVRPDRSPCYQCFVMAMPEEEADQEVAAASDAVEIAYSDRPVPVEPGLALDVAPIGIMVAKLALNELVAGRRTTLTVLERDLAAPWYLWINRPEPDTPYAAWPPLSESSDEMTILRWYGVHLERESTCPVCGDFAAAVREAYGIEGGPVVELPEPPPGLAMPNEE